METKFNFKSAICTSRVQSERLLSLGLKKETADMCWIPLNDGKCVLGVSTEIRLDIIPAWSLHRLIEMTSDFCDVDGEEGVWCCECRALLGYRSVMTENWLIMWNKPSLYDNIIDCIAWLIKEGYFPKEYLVNQAEIEERCKGVLEYLDFIRKDD